MSTFTGGTGDDTLEGAATADLLQGLAGNDLLAGVDGNDTLDGGSGADTLDGGQGDDIYIVDSSFDQIQGEEDYAVYNPSGPRYDYYPSGNDTIQSSVDWHLGDYLENLTLTGSASNATGNELDNVLIGNAAANVLRGGAGSDTLTGGAGPDLFDFDASLSSTLNIDTITDFDSSALDKLRLADHVFREFAAHAVEPAQFYAAAGATTAQDADQRIIYNTTNGALYYDVDGIGGTAAVKFAVLTGHPVLSANDFVVGNDRVNGVEIGDAGDMFGTAAITTTNSAIIGATGFFPDNGDIYAFVADANGAFTADLTGLAFDLDLYLFDSEQNVLASSYYAGHYPESVSSSVTAGNTYYVQVATYNDSTYNLNLSLSQESIGTVDADVFDLSAPGAEQARGLAGDDLYLVNGPTDIVIEAVDQGTDTVECSQDYTLGDNLERLTLTGVVAEYGTGNALNNLLTGNSASNELDGAAGADTMNGGLGDDYYRVDNVGDVVNESFNSGTDTIYSSVSWILGSDLETLSLTGYADISGTGNSLDNEISGNSYDNTLDGGAGADTIYGGDGNDILVVDDPGDVLIEYGFAGIDTVQTALSWSIATKINIEDITLTGAGAVSATGNTVANILTGNGANNTLDGGTGADTLVGGGGNDTYLIDSADDVVSEAAAAGEDTVRTGVAATVLAANVENLEMLVTTPVSATGNALANTITGNANNNTLDGGAGNDTLIGGAGDDTYMVDATDTITENAAAGTDTVDSSISWSLAALANVEKLVLTGGSAISGTGNALANVITGNGANNTLDGGSGADSLSGGLGDDVYIVDNATDVVTENASAGNDTLKTALSWSLAVTANIENLTLTGAGAVNGTGNAAANILTGNTAANVLNGAAGADTLIGGAGNDTYIVDNSADRITEAASAGTDGARSSVTFSLAAIANVETLTLTGAATINGTGNGLANTLTGNGADNVLNGGAGADTLVGGLGNDTYVVDNSADRITEAASAGTDTVRANVTFSLAAVANVENLTLLGTAAINATGNELPNVLTGNSANNVLEGGQGLDQMYGGAGNDSYRVDNSADTVFEAASAGTDTVYSPVDFVLTPNVEHLVLEGTLNSKGTGTALADLLEGNSGNNELSGLGGNDTLIGNAGNDTLIGGTGADSMVGGTGNDVYQVDSTLDKAIELASGGIDRVESLVSYTVGANIENLVLLGTGNIGGTGNALSNHLDGNSGNNNLSGLDGSDTINGGQGADTMVGGNGDDTYYVQSAGDLVTEAATSPLVLGLDIGSNIDTVVASITYTLTANVEYLTLAGSANLNATGNGLGNKLYGNNGANLLDGKAGVDTLQGGLGNDTYIVDNSGDVVTETGAAGGGVDIVKSSVSYVLSNYVESLIQTGTGAINATGNTLGNSLTGNSAANVLSGGAGNDLLYGKLGADSLTGGTGADAFVFDTALASTNVDTVNDFAHLGDKLRLDDDIFSKFTAGVAITSAQLYVAAGAVSAHDADDRLIYNTTTGALYYDADGNGAASSAIKFAVLGTTTHPTLSAGDFVVIA